MGKAKKEVTISEAIEKYRVDVENSSLLLKNLFEHTLFLDAVVTKLMKDPLGVELYKKIESEIKLELLQRSSDESITQ
jgi:hypothetical protein